MIESNFLIAAARNHVRTDTAARRNNQLQYRNDLTESRFAAVAEQKFQAEKLSEAQEARFRNRLIEQEHLNARQTQASDQARRSAIIDGDDRLIRQQADIADELNFSRDARELLDSLYVRDLENELTLDAVPPAAGPSPFDSPSAVPTSIVEPEGLRDHLALRDQRLADRLERELDSRIRDDINQRIAQSEIRNLDPSPARADLVAERGSLVDISG